MWSTSQDESRSKSPLQPDVLCVERNFMGVVAPDVTENIDLDKIYLCVFGVLTTFAVGAKIPCIYFKNNGYRTVITYQKDHRRSAVPLRGFWRDGLGALAYRHRPRDGSFHRRCGNLPFSFRHQGQGAYLPWQFVCVYRSNHRGHQGVGAARHHCGIDKRVAGLFRHECAGEVAGQEIARPSFPARGYWSGHHPDRSVALGQCGGYGQDELAVGRRCARHGHRGADAWQGADETRAHHHGRRGGLRGR